MCVLPAECMWANSFPRTQRVGSQLNLRYKTARHGCDRACGHPPTTCRVPVKRVKVTTSPVGTCHPTDVSTHSPSAYEPCIPIPAAASLGTHRVRHVQPRQAVRAQHEAAGIWLPVAEEAHLRGKRMWVGGDAISRGAIG